jgi:hypothetical protein
MQGDFTLDPFTYRDGVSRVLAQQGRVQLDSDANEQTEVLLRFLRGLGRDLIGPHGGVNDSFRIDRSGTPPTPTITRGEYYVDGIRCILPQDGDLWEVIDDPQEANARTPIPLGSLPNYVPLETDVAGQDWLFYLDVYERHVSAAEDDSIREVALLGADTASRALLTFRIRVLLLDAGVKGVLARAKTFGWPFEPAVDDWYATLNLLLRTGVRMRAEAAGSDSTNPCIIAPGARYRGTENRLFRVEIHDPGAPTVIQPGAPSTAGRRPTLKWSQDNASIVYPIRKVAGATIHLASLGRDARTQICVNDWVEVVDDFVVLNSRFHPLLQVLEVRSADMTVLLNAAPQGQIGSDPARHPILRRWASNLIPIDLPDPATGKESLIELADGVQVAFSRVARPLGGFRTGDYWLIPTRTANGELAWPRDSNGDPRAMPPNGVDHHYAPLASWGDRNAPNSKLQDLRRKFQPLARP